jgi:putative glycosyltransferase (TIGR04372 family)
VSKLGPFGIPNGTLPNKNPGPELVLQDFVRRIGHFVVAQTARTLARPWRLLFVPLLLLSSFPRVTSFIVNIMPLGSRDSEDAKTYRLQIGNILLHQDRPEQAWQWMQRVLGGGFQSSDEYFLATVCLFQGLGRFRDAVSLFSRINEQNFERAKSLGLDNSRYRLLDNLWSGHLGDAATLDYVIKLGILEGRAPEDTILYLPPGSRVANRFLLQQIATRLSLIEHAKDLPFTPDAASALCFHYQFPRGPDGNTTHFWQLASETNRRWEQESKGPLLVLPPEIEKRGWSGLREAGMPTDAWFVALHLREGRWDGRSAGMHGIRNADMSTYLPAIAEITRRGGWVLRMGDPGMNPMPRLPNVIDYCHSAIRADWMDIFIVARSRFLLGTTSGPAFIPPLYGVPSVLTNWWPPAQRPWRSSEIFLPKMLRRIKDQRYLSLSESFREPFSYCHSRNYLTEREGVLVEDNDPELIRDAVIEMLDRMDGRAAPDTSASDWRACADRIYEVNKIVGRAQLATALFRRHENFIR